MTEWIGQTCPADSSWRGVSYAPELGIFVAVASAGTYRSMYSYDGKIWIASSDLGTTLQWNKVSYSAALGRFVAIASNSGSNTQKVAISQDGIDWTTGYFTTNQAWRNVIWVDDMDLFVACANDGTGRIATSPDGMSWTTRSVPAALAYYGLAYSPSLGLIVCTAIDGVSNRVITSPDGINWTLRTSSTANGWQSICWSEDLDLFVAGGSTSSTNAFLTSPDGINWTVRTISTARIIQGVVWSSHYSKFFAITGDNSGVVLESTDGIIWTETAASAALKWYGITDGPGRSGYSHSIIAAVAGDGIGNGIMTYGAEPPGGAKPILIFLGL